MFRFELCHRGGEHPYKNDGGAPLKFPESRLVGAAQINNFHP